MATEATRDTRHVVLARPGDVLLIGNVGPINSGDRADRLDLLVADLKRLGISVYVFAADIDVDQLSELERQGR